MTDKKSYVIRLTKGFTLTTPFGIKLRKKGRGLTISGDDESLPYYLANASIEVTEIGSAAPVGVGATRRKQRRKALRATTVTPAAGPRANAESPASAASVTGDAAPAGAAEETATADEPWTPDEVRAAKKPELVKLAEALGLDVYGTDRKSDLIARIEEAREQAADA